MNDDFRQTVEFRALLSDDGTIPVELGFNEVGYAVRVPILRFLYRIMLPRITHPDALIALEASPYRNRSIFIAVAPKAVAGSESAQEWLKLLDKYRYRPSSFGLAPTKTVLLNLSLSEEELLAQMKSKTRYNTRLAERRGVQTRTLDGEEILNDERNLDDFYNVYHENCVRINFPSNSRDSIHSLIRHFKKNLFITYADSSEGQVVAVALYLVSGDTVFYQQNGSTEQGRKDFATNLMVWQGILEGRRRGCRWFDFDGIFDERFQEGQKDWHGFSRFKQGFGGEDVEYLPPYIKWFPMLKKAK